MRTNTILKTISARVPVQPRDESAFEELDVWEKTKPEWEVVHKPKPTKNPNRPEYWDLYDPTNEDDVDAHVALQYCVEKSIQALLSMRPGEEIGARIRAMEVDYWERHDLHFKTGRRTRYPKGGTNNDEKVAFPDLDFESIDSESKFKSMITVHPLFVFADNNPMKINSRKFHVVSHVFDPKKPGSRIIIYDNTYSIRGRTLTRYKTSLEAEQDGQTDVCKGFGINKIFWDNIEHKVKMNYFDAFVVDMIKQTQTIRALLTKMASPAIPSDHKCRWHFTTSYEYGKEIDFVILSQRPTLRVHVMMPTQVEQNWLLNLLRPPKGVSLAVHIATLGLNATFTKSFDMREQRAKPRRNVFSAHGHDFEDTEDTSGTRTRHNTRHRPPSRYTYSADSDDFDE